MSDYKSFKDNKMAVRWVGDVFSVQTMLRSAARKCMNYYSASMREEDYQILYQNDRIKKSSILTSTGYINRQTHLTYIR